MHHELPRSTPKAALKVLAEQAELIEALRAQLAAATDMVADSAIAKADARIADGVFDRVNVRNNQYGEVLNCRISEDCEALNLRIASKALGRTITQNHSKVRSDRHGRKWIDFYAATSAAPANIMEEVA